MEKDVTTKLRKKYLHIRLGFTIIEVMVSLAVLGIVSSFVALAISDIYNENKTKSMAKLFQDNLRHARHISRIHKGYKIVFCALSKNNSTKCAFNNKKNQFEYGWQWFVSRNNNAVGNQYDPATDQLLGNTTEIVSSNINVLAPESQPPIDRNELIYTKGKIFVNLPSDKPGAPSLPSFIFSHISGSTSTVSINIVGDAILTQDNFTNSENEN